MQLWMALEKPESALLGTSLQSTESDKKQEILLACELKH